MLRIWKYQLPDTDHPRIKMPKGTKILSFKFQNKIPCLWAFVDIEKPEEERNFWLVETGQPIQIDPSYLYYIGSDSYETPAGPYVVHLFELTKKGQGNLLV
jgi:hypothetical protein